MNTIKKIVYTVFCVGALSSCMKDDMEVQKNNDLTWEIDESLIKDDIRTSIGYDPRYNYIGVEKSEIGFPVLTLGDFVFSEKASGQLKVSLYKPAEKEITVSLGYNPDLYNELKNKYGGYSLGDENLVKIIQSEKIISEGESSAVFDIEGNFTDTKKMILPFSLSVQGNDSIRKIEGSDIFVVKTDISSFLDSDLRLNLSEASPQFVEIFDKLKEMPITSEKYSSYQISVFLEEGKINFGEFDGKTGISFTVNFAGTSYDAIRKFDLDKNNFTMNLTEGEPGGNWTYFSDDLEKILELINNNAPYKFEKIDGSTVKLISKNNPEMWFTMEKR